MEFISRVGKNPAVRGLAQILSLEIFIGATYIIAAWFLYAVCGHWGTGEHPWAQYIAIVCFAGILQALIVVGHASVATWIAERGIARDHAHQT